MKLFGFFIDYFMKRPFAMTRKFPKFNLIIVMFGEEYSELS